MIAPGTCHLVLFKNGNVDSGTYKNLLSLVLHMLNNGLLADGWHGSEAHLAALRKIIDRANEVIREVERDNAARRLIEEGEPF